MPIAVILLVICFSVIPTKANATAVDCAANVAAQLLATAVINVTGGTAVGQTSPGSLAWLTAAGAGATASGAQLGLSVPISNVAADILLAGIGSVTSAHAGFQDLGKMSLDSFSYAVGQCALQLLTDNTIEWITGGGNGDPLFATDLNETFLAIADRVSDGMATQIFGIATCDFTPTFKGDLISKVSLSTRRGATSKFDTQIKCPLQNSRDFYRDFSNGGWTDFENALSSAGNPFDVTAQTSQELYERQYEEMSLMEQQLSWSGGFLPDTEIGDYDVYTGLPINTQTKTPGKVISDTLSKSLGTDMDRLGFADNMNKIISALLTAATDKLMDGSGLF